MRNESVFEEKLTNSVPYRKEIKENFSVEMNKLRKMFVNAFSAEGKDFTFLKDSLYYRGGCPKEDSPARLESLFSKVAIVAKYCTYLGKEAEFEKYTSQFGILVEPVGDPAAYLDSSGFEDESAFRALWCEIFVTEPPFEKKEIMNKLVDYGLELQKNICELADKIKIENGEVVEESCSVKPSVFNRAVSMKLAKEKGKKDLAEKIQEMVEQSELNIEAMEKSIKG